VAGALLVIIAGMGLFWPPMHLRGINPTLTDTMHIVFASVVALLTMLAVAFGSASLGKRFRIFSMATIGVLVVFGALAFLYAPQLAANLPTPWLGAMERTNIGAYLLWVAVLAVALLREPPRVQ
jgi:hypothetical protein